MADKISLNPEQKKAITHKKGPLLVVAGAGTGKTRVITERIKHLMQKEKVGSNEILALTFTEKASQEMLSRVDEVMPLAYEEPWIYTFHSFADRILKREGLEIGLDTSYKILSYPEQWLLLKKNLFELGLDYYLPMGNPTKFISAILKFISRLQDENISPENLGEFVEHLSVSADEKKRWSELAQVYKKYSELKIQNSRLDFGDLITWTIRLFSERSNVLERYKEQFKHILVDEFQDTNYAQYELVKLLCPQEMENRSLLVVGDDSQSIYKFRGAAISNILEFQKDYPQAEMVTLLKNYRSNQKILDASYSLVQNNNPDTLESKLGISKELVSELTEQRGKPNVCELETLEDEVEFTVWKILDILAQEPKLRYKDIAILARANNHLDPFVMALRKYGLPYQLVGNRGLYDREEVRDVLALLKVLINLQDSISLFRVLNIDCLEIPQDIITRCLSQARYKKVDLWSEVKANSNEKVKSLVVLLTQYADKIVKQTPVELIYEFVNSIGYIKQYTVEETIENNLSVRNLDLFLNKVKEFEVAFRNDSKSIPTVVDFVDYIELMIEAGDNPAQAEIEDLDTINLLTVHASKGLEFSVVFMVNLVSDRFPTRNRSDMIEIPDELIKETLPSGDAHIQEERRLFYVGMTRAKEYLYMLYGKNYGGKREKRPSGFTTETKVKVESVDMDEIKNSPRQSSLFSVETGFREPKLVEKRVDFTPTFLSYTQISTYKTCPLKYKYSYVLRIPTAPNAALSFGSTVHDTLNQFHSALRFNDVSLDKLYDIYEKCWQPLGYDSEAHRQKRFSEGKKILQKYYDDLDKSQESLGIERSFNVKIAGVKFYGRIDRIVPTDSGGVEIIDYKTGSVKSQKEVDSDDQMDFYAIGAREALNLNPEKFTFYFLEAGEKVSTVRDAKDLEKKKEEVAGIVEEIKDGKFEATPGMFNCQWCDYKEICPFAEKR